MERMEISKGKLPLLHSMLCTWQSHAFLPLQPLPTALGEADGTSIRTMNLNQRKETNIKGGVKGGNVGDSETPTTHHVPEKLLRSCRWPTFFDKFSSSLLDCHEHHINCYPCTKA